MSSIMGYHYMLATVFHFKLPNMSSDLILHDLVRFFRIEAPVRPLRPLAWDLSAVLHFLNSSVFEPLHRVSLHNLTKVVLFLVSLATAKRVGELQAVSRTVYFVRPDACLSYVPEFVTKTEFISNPLPRSFLVAFLSDFAAGLDDELLLYPVRTLRISSGKDFLFFLLFLLVVIFCPLDALLRLCRRLPFLYSYGRYPWDWCCKAGGRFCGSP